MLRLMKNRDSFRMICQAELSTGMLGVSDYVSRFKTLGLMLCCFYWSVNILVIFTFSFQHHVLRIGMV